MKSLTVRLPDILVAEIERESATRRISKSDVVRERLHRDSKGPGGMSDSIGDILEECWKAKVPTHPPRFRSRKKQKLAEKIRAKKLPCR